MKISVVIPVYNVEKYLPRCLDSVINQTYTDLEIILVDDGSTDGCGEICDEYAAADKRIRVIHKTNGGLSDARNAGIEIASGEYITFIDSDDSVSGSCVELLLKTAEKYDADIVQGRYTSRLEELGTLSGSISVMTGEEAFRQIMLFGDITVNAWAKLYRTRLFDSIRFPKGRINEDSLTTYKVVLLAGKVVSMPDNIYFYFIRSDSIIGRKLDKERCGVAYYDREIAEYLGADAEKYSDEIEHYRTVNAVGIYNQIVLRDRDGDLTEEKNAIRKLILTCNRSNPYLSRRYRTAIVGVKFAWLYELMLKTVYKTANRKNLRGV